jgi:hypothetical protein
MCVCLSFSLRTGTHACVDSAHPSPSAGPHLWPVAQASCSVFPLFSRTIAPLLTTNSEHVKQTKTNGGSNLHNNPVARLAAACVRVCVEQSTQRRRRRWGNAATRSAPAESCTRTRPGPVSGRGGAGSRGAPAGLGRLRGYVDDRDHVDDDDGWCGLGWLFRGINVAGSMRECCGAV